jgi:hypothetical protein
MDDFAPSPLTAFGFDPASAPPSAMVAAPTLLPLTAAPPEAYRAARRGAGVGLVLATAGTGTGFWLGGPMGAGAGLLLVGAARNTLRATRGWSDADPSVRQDAGTSASLALFGALLGGYLAYRVYAKSTGETP